MDANKVKNLFIPTGIGLFTGAVVGSISSTGVDLFCRKMAEDNFPVKVMRAFEFIPRVSHFLESKIFDTCSNDLAFKTFLLFTLAGGCIGTGYTAYQHCSVK